VGVVVRRNNKREAVVKWNYDVGWSFDDVVLWLEKMKNRDMIE
jgi:hypothetical protein